MALYLFGFAGVLILLLVLFMQVLLEPMYENYKTKQIKSAASEIATLMESDADEDELTEEVMNISMQNDTCIRIIDGRGTDQVTGNMGCVLYRLSNQEIIQQISLASENNNEVLTSTFGGFTPAGNPGAGDGNDDEVKNLTLTKILDTEEGKAVIMVYSGLSPINATLSTLRMQIVYIAFIILVAIILLITLLNRNVARPLNEITREAKQLAHGEYHPQEGIAKYTEIEDLNNTLQSAAKDIHKADKAKRDLIANVSHDLRTPLTMIQGYGEMMRDLPGEKTDENLQVIIDETQRLKYLVNDMLDLSRLEDNRITLKKEEFFLNDLLQRNLKKFDLYTVNEGFEIETKFEDNLVVEADEMRVEQVFNNFVVNAINYSGNSKKIIVRAFKEGKYARVEVQDFGEGIEESRIDDIWERYYKIDKEHVRQVNSSGIGLSICKKILELHQVPYGVNSKLNEGSTFWFCLPIYESKGE